MANGVNQNSARKFVVPVICGVKKSRPKFVVVVFWETSGQSSIVGSFEKFKEELKILKSDQIEVTRDRLKKELNYFQQATTSNF